MWMHHMVTNKTHREKVRWGQRKNAACYLEQILKATLHKRAAVQQPASHLRKKIQVKRKRHVENCRRRKDRFISNILGWTPAHSQANVS